MFRVLERSTVLSVPGLGVVGFKKSLHLSGQGGCRIWGSAMEFFQNLERLRRKKKSFEGEAHSSRTDFSCLLVLSYFISGVSGACVGGRKGRVSVDRD